MFFIRTEPQAVDFVVSPIRFQLTQELIELVAKCSFFRIVLAEGERVPVVGQPFFDIVDLGLLCVDAFQGGFIAQIGIDDMVLQSYVQVRVSVEVQVLAVGKTLERFGFQVRTGHDADLFPVVILICDGTGLLFLDGSLAAGRQDLPDHEEGQKQDQHCYDDTVRFLCGFHSKASLHINLQVTTRAVDHRSGDIHRPW